MSRPWATLNGPERETFRATIAFLSKRLCEEATINWALRLRSDQRTERIVVADLLNSPGTRDLPEPWCTVWHLIEESWSSDQSDQSDATVLYGIQKRLRAGDHSGALVATLVDLVAPRLKVEPIGAWRWTTTKKPRKPKFFEQLVSAQLTSPDLIDVRVLDLAANKDLAFLTSLANALDAAVVRGLDIARRLGWDGKSRLWLLGEVGRVYYVSDTPRARGDEDPDAYHRGIAPSVKLLHAVVARIADIDPAKARPFLRRWEVIGSPIHMRLWAAMSRNSPMTPTDQVSAFILSLSDDMFWDLHEFPEIAELRAGRFHELDLETRKAVASRLEKGPPRRHWPRHDEAGKIARARLYWAVRELKRIEVAGGILPKRSKTWLDTRSTEFGDLAEMSVDDGFPEGIVANYVRLSPDDRYDSLKGVARLHALETAFSTSRGGWDNNVAGRANDWIQQSDNSALILRDLEDAGRGGDDYPAVWERFGWAHRRRQQGGEGVEEDMKFAARRVTDLLVQLSDTTLSTAVEGISSWLDNWRKQVVGLPLGLPIWFRIWPIAVEATNLTPESAEETDLSVTATAAADREPMDLDTLNTPSGKLVGVFLAACPTLVAGSRAFVAGSTERQMRDTVISAGGRSGLIVKHRLIEDLPYFLNADREWAREHLIKPLKVDDGAALTLWRAVARGAHSKSKTVLDIIGGEMAERAADPRLGRETRRRLVFNLIVESLYALKDRREPAVPYPRIQQMLRTVDDETRSSAANTIRQFVKELSAKFHEAQQQDNERLQDGKSAATLFRSAAKPFLRDVWPQERSLATPGVSSALADLPAASNEAFAEAVGVIERFLVPFECWSMLNYGLYGDERGSRRLAIVDDEPKATALLILLDLTIGNYDGAVTPHDLTDALDQITAVAPSLVQSPTFRRLSTAARRQ